MSTAVITAIVVNYNTGELLSRCIELLQREPLIGQVHVIDNDSSDGSLTMLEQVIADDARVTITRNDLNVGFAQAVNQGLGSVNTTYALLINPDCLVGDGVLPALVAQ